MIDSRTIHLVGRGRGCQRFFSCQSPERIGIAWRTALSLLASHNIALNTRLVVVHFVSDRRLRRDESYPRGIRFVPSNLIRFHGRFYSSKVMAKLKNSGLLSCT
jgi:hypothetical protein